MLHGSENLLTKYLVKSNYTIREIAKVVSFLGLLGARSSQTVPPSGEVPGTNIDRLGPGYRLVVFWS